LADVITPTDQELVALLKQGDEAAFKAIYDRYALPIFFQVNQMLRDEETSKDLVQDLFITVWSKAALINENANLAGYLHIAARNRVLKAIQKGKLRNDYLNSLARFATEVSTATIDEITERELSNMIEEAIEKLPPKMKEVFELSRKQNLTYSQIAEQLGISDKTVKKQIHNALKIIKGKLNTIPPAGILLLAFLSK